MINTLLLLRHTKTNLLKPNYKMIPVTELRFEEKDLNFFNNVYIWLNSQQDWHNIIRTNSYGISYKNLMLPAWSFELLEGVGGELIILTGYGHWRIQIRNASNSETGKISGTQAFKEFSKICKQNHIDLEAMKITNGIEVKETIEKYIIELEKESYKNIIFENVHHIDFHSSFPAGLCNCFEQFRPVINKLYEGRKIKKINKAILNHTIGYMQSKKCGRKAEWAHLSKAAIADNNKRIRELRQMLINSGRMPLLYNTDGIWYTGEIYHGENEGPGLGQWENDHINCKFRIKSAGAYEYIENDIYKPVIRGKTYLEKMGYTRDKWKWGDIYQPEATPVVYIFDKNKGFIEKENYDDENRTIEQILLYL